LTWVFWVASSQFLLEKGLDYPANLIGGMDEWKGPVDRHGIG
jgi:rhodanese-related sulfurtransferase